MRAAPAARVRRRPASAGATPTAASAPAPTACSAATSTTRSSSAPGACAAGTSLPGSKGATGATTTATARSTRAAPVRPARRARARASSRWPGSAGPATRPVAKTASGRPASTRWVPRPRTARTTSTTTATGSSMKGVIVFRSWRCATTASTTTATGSPTSPRAGRRWTAACSTAACPGRSGWTAAPPRISRGIACPDPPRTPSPRRRRRVGCGRAPSTSGSSRRETRLERTRSTSPATTRARRTSPPRRPRCGSSASTRFAAWCGRAPSSSSPTRRGAC